MSKVADTASVLDAMTQSIMGIKQDKAAKLTPVGMERPLPRTNASFPNDHPTEVIESAVKSIRREVAHIIAALDAIDATNGVPPADEPNGGIAAQKAAEREADAKHAGKPESMAARMKRLEEEAKAAIFRATSDEAKAVAAHDAASGWVCPTHGDEDVRTLKSGKGRIYRACAKCKEFEK